MKDVQLVIPMAGVGQRFIDAGYGDPKPFIRVDEKSIISHVVDLFPGIEHTNILFICNREHLENSYYSNTVLSHMGRVANIEPHKKGPVYSILQAEENIDDDKPVIVSYCDYGTDWNFEEFLSKIKDENFDAGIACYTGFHPHMLVNDCYAYCKEENGVLQEIREKDSFTSDRMSEYASNGTFYFSSGKLLKKYARQLIDRNLHINNEYYVSLMFNLLIKDGLKTLVFPINKMLQWGTPEDLLEYQRWSYYFESKNFTTIIPMMGKGQRFKDENYVAPKPLLNVDDLPMFKRAVDSLPESKKTIFVCLKNYIKAVRRYFNNAYIFVPDSDTLGPAHTCQIAIKEANIDLESPILVSPCDSILVFDNSEFEYLRQDERNDIIVFSFISNQTTRINPDSYSWLTIDENDRISNVACKSIPTNQDNAIIGTMFFRKARYLLEGFEENKKHNIKTNGEYCLDSILNQNIKSGLQVVNFTVDDHICLGTPNDYKTYQYWSSHFDKRS